MRARQNSVLEALRRARDFLDANQQLLGAANKSSARRNLDDILAQLAAHARKQDGSGRESIGETARQKKLRVALRFYRMRPIAAVAKRKLQGVPEFEALRLPRANLTGGLLVAAAQGMADAAQKHADVLIENGLTVDFIDRLLKAATELEKSVDDRSVLLGARTRSTTGLGVEEGRARTTLRVLDSAVRDTLGDNETLLSEWSRAKQVKRPRSAVGPVPAAPPPTVPVAPTTAPTVPVTPPPRSSVAEVPAAAEAA